MIRQSPRYQPSVALFCFLLSAFCFRIAAAQPCRIQVVEKGSGWPVSLVELRTTHNVRFITDNAGLIAFDLPELMGRETWFDISSPGYEVPRDAFGSRGVRFLPQPGGSHKIEVTRTVIAKRLGRLTGGGLFAESQKLGGDLDWRESGLLGQDSVQNAVYRGKMFWAWGDTTMPNYPLGIFDMTSATTPIQPLTSFEPPLRLKLEYFTDSNGRPRGVAKMPGSGPTWLGGYVSLPDKSGASHLVAAYMKVRNHLEAYETGLCVWDDHDANFKQLRVLWTKSASSPKIPPYPMGQPAFWKDASGKEWLGFGNPLPTLRCPATFETWQDSATWETLKPVRTLQSVTDAKEIKLHSGSIAWNSYRKRWVTIFMQAGGESSNLGELWYAEADSPTGPWGKTVKILSHINYTFYNPRIHPEFTPESSPILLFEGTYTAEFANHPDPTPRYNYNQILYRLDLDDPALRGAMGK